MCHNSLWLISVYIYILTARVDRIEQLHNVTYGAKQCNIRNYDFFFYFVDKTLWNVKSEIGKIRTRKFTGSNYPFEILYVYRFRSVIPVLSILTFEIRSRAGVGFPVRTPSEYWKTDVLKRNVRNRRASYYAAAPFCALRRQISVPNTTRTILLNTASAPRPGGGEEDFRTNGLRQKPNTPILGGINESFELYDATPYIWRAC